MRVITVANSKGGTGKSTTTVNLAAALGMSGKQVLVVDLDSQGHATQWLGIPLEKVPEARSSYAVLMAQTSLITTLVRTQEAGIVVCSAHPYLAKAPKELGEKIDGLFALRDALHSLHPSAHSSSTAPPQSIDYVLIDCPGAMGLVVFNALIAADVVIAPVLAESLSLEGLGELHETVRRIQQRYSPHLPLPRILINNYEGRSAADRQIHDYLHQKFTTQILPTEIGRDAPLRECFAHRQSIFRYRPGARSATQFERLAADIQSQLAPEA